MMIRAGLSILVSIIVFSFSGQTQIHDPRALNADPKTAEGPIAPRLEGLGDHHIMVTTESADSQYFFNQGYRLFLGFNHSEALRSFKEAARLDPENAMAYWGWALALGPNLNLPMQDSVVEQTNFAIAEANRLKAQASMKEQDLITALASRYSTDPDIERAALDSRYAQAMKGLTEKYPDDLDIAVLYVAAVMNTNPWDYWYRDTSPKPGTEEILNVLRSVIKRYPNHAGAHHYLIHLVEAFRPELAIASADQLGGLMPGAGHLVHMPSHIYMRVGRYGASAAANRLAIKADEGYITQCRAQGLYPLGYYPHNIHFLAWSAMFLGNKSEAIAAARQVEQKISADLRVDTWGLNETFRSQPMFVITRFGDWQAMLFEPKPSDKARFMTCIWHYGRGLAKLNRTGVVEAEKELNALREIRRSLENEPTYMVAFSTADDLLAIAENILTGEIAAKNGNYDQAVMALDKAVRLEDSQLYNEPPSWYFPVRHILGAILLEAGRAKEAEVVYWEDLRRNPENGYSLYGLYQALMAQDKTEMAGTVKARFDKAWVEADTILTSSRY